MFSNEGYCQGFLTRSTVNPVLFTSGTDNKFTLTAGNAMVVSNFPLPGAFCQFRPQPIVSTCMATSCPLKSITVTPANSSVVFGSVTTFVANGEL
jgi:hypothetical protein